MNDEDDFVNMGMSGLIAFFVMLGASKFLNESTCIILFLVIFFMLYLIMSDEK